MPGLHIALDAADAVGRQVHAVAVDGLLDVLHHLPHFHDVHEQGFIADDMRLDGRVEKMRGHPLDLLGHDAQIAGARRDDDAQHVLHGHAVGEGMAVGTERADAFGQRGVLDEVTLAGQRFHAAVHMPGGELHLADDLAVHGQMEVDGLLQRHMHRAERHLEGRGRAHAIFPLSLRIRSQRSVVQAPFIMTDSGTASLSTPASSSSSRKRRRGLGCPSTRMA